MEALVTVIGLVFEAEESQRRQAQARKLTGIAASPGRYHGTVRVLEGEHEFAKLEPGDVLVCPSTSPVWSVVFLNVGALVTDTGGLLSHPAIIAREYRVPAVVATGNATELLADGQVVTVDGTAGTVEIEE
jgi:pyruvate,water dikinase